MRLFELPVVSEAVTAHDRTVGAGLEGNLTGLSTLCANRIVHFALAGAGAVLPVGTAILAADGFILEALLRVEFLLARREYELRTAILAYQCLVFEHCVFSPFWFVFF